MSIAHATKENFSNLVLTTKVPVLVDFNASWCPPCQALKPTLEEIAENGGDFKIIAVDIDEEPELANEYSVSTIPCLVLFKDGAEIDRRVGLQPKRRLLKMLGVK